MWIGLLRSVSGIIGRGPLFAMGLYSASLESLWQSIDLSLYRDRTVAWGAADTPYSGRLVFSLAVTRGVVVPG